MRVRSRRPRDGRTAARAEPPPAEARADVLFELGRAEHALERATAIEHLREAHALASGPRERARAALLLTWAIGSGLREHPDLIGIVEQATEDVVEEDPELALELTAARMSAAWDSGLLEAALESSERYRGLQGRTPGECLVLARATRSHRYGRGLARCRCRAAR